MQALGLVWGSLDSSNSDLEEVCTPMQTPTQYGARLLLDHWQERERAGGFVVGRDVPSRALAGVLRNLAIYEPIDGDFRIRLASTAFLRRFGRDVTGLKLSEIYGGPDFEDQRANLARVILAKSPFIAEVKVERCKRVFLRFETVRLPVLSPDRKNTWVLGALFYSDWA